LDKYSSLLSNKIVKKIYYGYVVAAVAIVLQVIMWGTFNTYGVFFIPLQNEFGWSRAAISGARSLTMITWGFMSIPLGNLNDRFGPRIIMVICGCFFGVGYFLISQTNYIWQLYLFHGIIVGIGVSASDVILLSTVARWFIKKRGMITGIVKSGAGLGMFMMPLIANGLISSYSWRNSYIIFASLGFIFVVSFAQLLRRDPSQLQQTPDSEKEVTPVDLRAAESGLTFHNAIRTRQLWIVCILFLTTWFCINVVMVHITPHAIDIGISSTKAAGVLSAIGGIGIVGRISIGTMNDRIGCRRSIIICSIGFVISFLLLPFAKNFWMLLLFAMIYGISHGGFATTMSPLVGELFGLRSHGTILGLIIFFSTIGGAISPIFAGYMFDTSGSYQLVFLSCIAMAIIVLILSVTIKPVISIKS